MSLKKKWMLAAVLALMILTAVGYAIRQSIIQCETELSVAEYQIETDLAGTLRIVQLTDLHSWEFGDGNCDLVELVYQQKPDLILMTGDMLDKSDAGPDVACALIEELRAVAPVYYGYGNHETSWMGQRGKDLKPALTKAGATVLDVEYLDVEINGQAIRLGGYHGYYRQPGMLCSAKEQYDAEIAFANSFEATDRYKILLCHIPTTWLDWGYIDKYPVDLVLTGHYHGGQVRLPFVDGLIAPYVGWFPEYTEGVYYGEKATCILSTGLGSSPGIPRINNLPQMVVIDLCPR